MTAEIARRPAAAVSVHPSLVRRVYGFGSVFGKTLRDSRWSILVAAGVLGVIILAGGATMAGSYGTPETRRELADMAATLPPVMTGFYGNPVRVDTLGGFISWHYGAYFALLAGMWSILALSATLALEAKRGSLEFAAVTPMSRRKLALEKLAGHLAAVAIAMTVIGALAWATGAFFGKFPEDSIAPDAALGFALGLGLKALIAGSIAFAIAPILGRAAAGLAGALMVAGYLLNSYRTAVPAFEGPSNLLWFAWTRDFLPLAGNWDWPGLGLVALITVVLLAVGIELFARRDIGVTVGIRTPRMPRILLGVGGPLGRAAGELLPNATWWGIGLGLLAFVMSASSQAFVDELNRSPGLTDAVRNLVPGIDMTTSAGFLQMVFIDLGLALVGLAAATFVAGWASDETSGRFELLLTTPLSRARWAIASGLGSWVATVYAIAIVAVAMIVGVASTGEDPWGPAIGMLALIAYGGAMAGIGFAVGGLTRPAYAAPTVVAFSIGTVLLQVLAPALRMPDWVKQLALSDHMGHPLVGSWDPAGLAACAVLAVGGLLVGAWGLRRRDVG